MVAPCYYLACGMLADGGFAGRMRGVGEGEDGVDLAELERKMAALDREDEQSGVREDEKVKLQCFFRKKKILKNLNIC